MDVHINLLNKTLMANYMVLTAVFLPNIASILHIILKKVVLPALARILYEGGPEHPKHS